MKPFSNAVTDQTELPASSARSLKSEASKVESQSLALLRHLAGPERYARREADIVRVIGSRNGIAVPIAQMPGEVLASLLSSGAVRCHVQAGVARFEITREGRAALFRAGTGENAFGDQHRQIEHRETDGGQTVRANLREDPLAMLARQAKSSAAFGPGGAGIAAGERLRRDIEAACLPPRITANWDRLVVDGAGPGSGLTLTEVQAAARARVNLALKAVGPDFGSVLFDLCGFSKGIGEIEEGLGLPVRSGKVVLALALRALARHYGLGDEAMGEPSQPIRRWGTPDSRPAFPRGD
ncbi:hypothetical protein MCEMSEM23_00716 [Rhabdaerophilaceae bacterium]